MTRRYDRYAIVATLVLAGCDLVFSPGNGPTSDGPEVDAQVDGAPDDDDDGDTVVNSLDNCPATPNLDQANGDSDALGDACDNCISTTNQDQLDEDNDTRGDVCDLCPGMAVADEDRDAPPDGVGSACDPYPCDPTDSWVAFDGFFVDPGWLPDPASDWTVEPGQLSLDNSSGGFGRMIAPIDLVFGGVMTEIKVDGGSSYAIGIQVLSETASPWNGVRCLVSDDGLGHLFVRTEDNAGAIDGQQISGALDSPFYLMATVVADSTGGSLDVHCQLRRSDGTIQTSASAGPLDNALFGTRIGVYGRNVRAGFYWVGVTDHGPFEPLPCAAKPTR